MSAFDVAQGFGGLGEGVAQGLYTRGLAIWNAIKADATRFPTTYPPAAEVEADLTGLGGALQAAEGGGPIAKAALDVAADKVRQTLEFLGKYVRSVVRAGPVEDAPAIISNVLMFESAVGKRAPKPEIEARKGMTSGIVQLIALAVPSAAAYFWEYSVDQQAWTTGAPTAQARSSIAGRAVHSPCMGIVSVCSSGEEGQPLQMTTVFRSLYSSIA